MFESPETLPARLQHGSILLRALTQDDYPAVFRIRTHADSLHFWKGRYQIPTEREYYQDLDAIHRSHIDTFLVVSFARAPREVVGIAHTYDTSLVDGHTFGAISLLPDARNRRVGTITACLFLRYIFALSPIRKVYADVVSYNTASLALVRKLGFVEEGLFRAHRYHNGTYWDSHRLAFYQRDFTDLAHRYLVEVSDSELAATTDASAET